MEFHAIVEPNEPMRGLEVPPEVLDELGGGKRPRVNVTLNGHTWSTRIAIMRGRNLVGFSNANRVATGAAVGEQVAVQLSLADEPTTVAVPADIAEALAAQPEAGRQFDALTVSQRTQQIRLIDQSKVPETRSRRIEKLVRSLSSGS
jgi:hypothetical protein